MDDIFDPALPALSALNYPIAGNLPEAGPCRRHSELTSAFSNSFTYLLSFFPDCHMQPSPSACMSSWWDKYLAPGDLRAQNRQQQDHQQSSQPTPSPTSAIPQRISAAHRARRQNALLLGGFVFTTLSLIITRRASRKKYLATYPTTLKPNPKTGTTSVPHFTASNTSPKAEGGLDAAEALFIATLSVSSIFMLGIGGFMKYYDVADVEDLREFVRKGTGQDVFGGDRDEEAEKEIEGWMAEVLARRMAWERSEAASSSK